jgi:hypothetical protein
VIGGRGEAWFAIFFNCNGFGMRRESFSVHKKWNAGPAGVENDSMKQSERTRAYW